MLDGTQILNGVALLLQGIICRTIAFQRQLGGLQFHGLLGVGRRDNLALHNDGAANVQLGSSGIVGIFGIIDHLQVGNGGAVIQFHESTGLHIAGSADPALEGNGLAHHFLRVVQDLSHSNNRHIQIPLVLEWFLQHLLEGLCDLVGAGSAAAAAVHTQHGVGNFGSGTALDQTGNTLQVAIAAAGDHDVLNDIVIAQRDLILTGAHALRIKNSFFAHKQDSS